MDRLKNALLNLKGNDVNAKIENGTIYVIIGEVELELSEFEITFQASEWEEKSK